MRPHLGKVRVSVKLGADGGTRTRTALRSGTLRGQEVLPSSTALSPVAQLVAA